MRMLRQDAYARRPITYRAPVTGPRPGRLFAFVFVSVALLFLSGLRHSQIAELRLQLAEVLAPVLKLAQVPLEPVRRVGRRVADYVDLTRELDRLRAENRRLRDWEWRAQETDRRANQLARLARVVNEPGLPFMTARVVADASGPFVRSAMLGIGRDGGMKTGYPVIDPGGLVGRIVETGARVSRVLLVTDLNSRVPVDVGATRVRAVMIGDNGAAPRLGHLPADARIEVGDEVATSGTGGLFPRGLRIGTVIADGGTLRVRPHAKVDELDLVSILLFENPTLEIADDDKAIRTRETPAKRSAVGRTTAAQGVPVP
jgi:rod shape-determining protein MreC